MKNCLLCGAGLAVALLLTQNSQAADLQPGDPAPDFELQGSDGQTYKLADLKGKTVVIAWFPAAFTGGCTKECQSLRTSGAQLREFDVAYFAASTDDAATNKKFAEDEKMQLDYPVLSDPSGETAMAYGLIEKPGQRARRTTVYIDPEGKILFIDRAVDFNNHGQDVVAKLGELGVAKKEPAGRVVIGSS